MYAYAESLAVDFAANFDLFLGDEPRDPADEILHYWGIYLGVLALDVFKSSIALLNAKRERAVRIISRPLIEYDVRLRYYVVQALRPIRAMRSNPDKDRELFLGQIHAVIDWRCAKLSLGKKLGQYERDAWPDEVVDEIQSILDDPKAPSERGFREMLRWLIKEEATIRSVPSVLQGRENLAGQYVNSTAEWLMSTLLNHGDSGGNSEVFEMSPDFKPTGKIWTESAASEKTVLFSAIWRLLRMIETFGMIRPWSYGWTMKTASDLWVSSTRN